MPDLTPRAMLVFAAGFGARMRDLTRDRPKPLISVAGRPLIDHALGLSSSLGLRRVVNLHYRGGMIRDHLRGTDVLFSNEPDRILETGGGLRAALPLLDADPVFTLNSDAVWTGPNPLCTLDRAWDPARMEALLLLLPPHSATGHRGAGDFAMDDEGRLHRAPGFVYSGAQIICTGSLGLIPDDVFSLNRVWDGMIERGTLFGAIHPGGWCDVGQPESIALAEALLETA